MPSSVAGTVKDVKVKQGEKVKVGQLVLTVDDEPARTRPKPTRRAPKPKREGRRGAEAEAARADGDKPKPQPTGAPKTAA